ncbi:MAG: hypothetical protein KF690_00920 [Bacteroidetes bacterium]|nr:hypothetical protein [Bacteroidota bacterium]
MRNRQLYILFAVLATISAISRVTPHWENFAPLGAFALFAGALFPARWWAVLPVLAAMLVSDVLLHFTRDYPIWHGTTLWVYGGYALVAGMGWLLRRQQGVARPLVLSVIASLLFFLVTNVGSWVVSDTGNHPPFSYPADLQGLVTAVQMGWPFYRMTLLADVLYTLVFFGGWAWFQRSQQVASRQHA